MKFQSRVLLAGLLVPLATGPSGTLDSSGGIRRVRYLMGTLCEIHAYGEGASQAVTVAFEQIAQIERWMSLYISESEVSRVNREAALRPVRCSPELWSLLESSRNYFLRTSGAFDPTAGSPGGPGFGAVSLDPKTRTVRFQTPGLRLDFGGIGKGYSLDRAGFVLKKQGIRHALLNFGGQVLALGSPPGRKGWEVVVADPFNRGAGVTLQVREASVSTSGQDQRPGHILDPKTGEAVLRPGSVTVVSPSATEADALSTAFFVRGIAYSVELPRDACVLVWTQNAQESPRWVGRCDPLGRSDL